MVHFNKQLVHNFCCFIYPKKNIYISCFTSYIYRSWQDHKIHPYLMFAYGPAPKQARMIVIFLNMQAIAWIFWPQNVDERRYVQKYELNFCCFIYNSKGFAWWSRPVTYGITSSNKVSCSKPSKCNRLLWDIIRG